MNFALGWAREIVLALGWDFEVWSEPPEAELANLHFLAGYRRDWLFSEDLLAESGRPDLPSPVEEREQDTHAAEEELA
ncbi:hypothetical protein [Streptomyces sp. bgisy060]|uniref:hypothetical protein n=1 Tax=Streptomyces sp. bgisy060 TaxID=3413775 RepID=UPI003EB6F7CF